MKIDLSTLNENELRTFSYADTRAVIVELEQIWISDFTGIDAIEKVETYFSFVKLIKNRVSHHEFCELSGKSKRDARQYLHARLNFLFSSFKYFLEINSLQKRMDQREQKLDASILDIQNQLQTTVEDYNAKKSEIETNVANVQTEFHTTVNSTKTDLEGKVEAFQERINDSEHTILTHVLTLMGVFSAVITIIMSVVITSSSWLNSADGASAITAFTIPNLVALLAVIVLISLVFIYHNAVNKSTLATPKSAVTIVFFSIVLVIILILSIAMAQVAVSHIETTKAAHVRYVISPSEYTVVEDTVDDPDACVRHFEFSIEKINYSFTYDEIYIHDGNLYFCIEHNMLE